MNYTKILMSASMIAFVVALVFSGTQAFFSDEETSTGNTFTAGAIDLLIDNSSYGFDWNNPDDDPDQTLDGDWIENTDNSWEVSDLTDQLFFSFTDLKPGDYGEDTISLHVNDNDAFACMAFDLTGTPENEQNEPEAEVDETAGEDEGELQNYLSFMFWNDDGDNVLEVGEDVIEELSGLPGSIFSGDWLPIAEAGDEPLAGGSTQYIGKGWCFGEMTEAPVAQDGASTTPPSAPDRIGFTCNGAGDHNDAQTDGIVVDVAFHAVQARHNDDFLCSSLGEDEPTPVATSTLRLVKQVINDDGGLATSSAFQLSASGTTPFSYSGSASTTVVVVPGVYDLSETGPAGYTASAWVCEGEALQNDSDTVTVAAGEEVTCTITNDDNEIITE